VVESPFPLLWPLAYTTSRDYYVTHDQKNENISHFQWLKWLTTLTADGLLMGGAIQ